MENEYKDRLNDLITKHSSNAPGTLRDILKKLYKGDKTTLKSISNAAYLREQITHKDKNLRITSAALKNHVKKNIIDALAENEDLKFRASVVFRHLTGYDKAGSNFETKDLKAGIDQIMNDGKFPHPQPKNYLKEGTEDDYSTASSIFTGKKSQKKALIFVVAILGIELDYLANQLKKFSPETEPKRTKRKLITFAFLLVLTTLIAIWYLRVDQPRNQLFYQVRVEEIFSESLISLDTTIPVNDSISLQVVQIAFDDFLIRTDTIALNEVWIRLMVSNHSDSLKFFPDGLFLLPNLQEHLTGNMYQNQAKHASHGKANLYLPTAMNRTFEWQIINNSRHFYIPPRKHGFMFFKLIKDDLTNEGLYSFKLSLEGFDQKKEPFDAVSSTFKLAIH
ncbi:MAG: hypothetical protein HRT61_12860 [Ekhidna sp.]|nr:hypothetical protein [Ekhidna sp.]